MDELMISGRRYVSSARAAKEHGYHSDYIGQLIRGSKVKGQKVGRAWYVDAESLAIYLGKEISQAIAEHEAEKKEVKEEEVAAVTPAMPEVAEVAEEPIKEVEQPMPQVVAEPAVEKIEERRVPIAKIGEKPLRPVREPETIIEVPRKMSGLKYVSGEESLLPEIQKNRMVSREFEVVSETVEDPVHGEVRIEIEERPSPRGFLRQGIALTALGVIVLIVVTAASSLFVFNMSVGSSETAGVQFALPQ